MEKKKKRATSIRPDKSNSLEKILIESFKALHEKSELRSIFLVIVQPLINIIRNLKKKRQSYLYKNEERNFLIVS